MALQAEPAAKIQVVNEDGEFQEEQVARFVQDVHLTEQRTDYQVVAIMGPQSSGKSTLLNHVFGTTFVMMDAMNGRAQTTKGIWLSRATKLPDNTTLVMDLEGNDGRERGEDNTNFERQIALFALAVADVLLVNIWCHDIGREQGSGKPLLRTIFQVNLKLFAPEPNRRKARLLFVIRDKSKTPTSKLIEVLEDDLAKLWESISKPPLYQDSRITDFFDVHYAAMAHFEERYDDFLLDAGLLRRRFTPEEEGTLVRPGDQLPGGAFALSLKGIWDTIREQKDLNLPAHKVMVANIRCAEIARDQLAALQADQAWVALAQATAPHPGPDSPLLPLLPSFNARLSQLLDSCIQGYNEDAAYFDARVRAEKLEGLRAGLRELAGPLVAGQTDSLTAAQLKSLENELALGLVAAGIPVPFTDIAARTRTASVSAFKKAFNEHLRLDWKGWDGKDAGAAFEAVADAAVARLRAARIADARSAALKQLATGVSGPVISLLDSCPPNLWPRLHAVARSAADNSQRGLLRVLSGFGLSAEEQAGLQDDVAAAAVARMEAHVREAALTRMSRMKDRFSDAFSLDASKAPRQWRPRDDIPAIALTARLGAAQLLAQLAVIRRPPPGEPATPAPPGGDTHVPDAVEAAIMHLARADLLGPAQGSDGGATGDGAGGEPGEQLDILSLAAWPDVEEGDVLLAPHEVRTAWRDFMTASGSLIQQAQAAQQALRLASNRAPPLWAVLAIAVLGWNEFMAVLFNPVYLILGALIFLFGRSLYLELDVEGEMARGPLPGALALAAKAGPAVRSVSARTRDAVQGFFAHPEAALNGVRALAHELELSTMLGSPGSAGKKTDGDGPRAGGSGHGVNGTDVGPASSGTPARALGVNRRRVAATPSGDS